MNTSRHILIALLAAAAMMLLAAGGVSCADRNSARTETSPSPDTLALVEGLRLFEEGKYDLAREQLRVSTLSTSTYIRAESFLYLNAVEMELGNYDEARPWLEKYHAETVRLLRRAAEASERTAAQADRLRRRNDTLVAVMMVAAVLAAGATVFFTKRRKHPGRKHIRKEVAPIPPDTYEWNGWLDDAGRFRQTAIWTEVVALAAQRPGREAAVMTSARQEVLDSELAEVFSDFAAHLRREYPALTPGDVKLCCLSLLPLSSFGRALCWGSTETNIVKQRKYTIKKKLWVDERGRALFGFIFEERR